MTIIHARKHFKQDLFVFKFWIFKQMSISNIIRETCYNANILGDNLIGLKQHKGKVYVKYGTIIYTLCTYFRVESCM